LNLLVYLGAAKEKQREKKYRDLWILYELIMQIHG